MGLTKSSVGINLTKKEQQSTEKADYIIALAGNPNVGKSTIFNLLTGMKQHTGNWPGKTVENAKGRSESDNHSYMLVDLPGTYSLMANSVEEEIARDYLCFEKPDATIVVCDATCLERNLNLVLQTLEISKKVLVCINLMDEAKKKGINININTLEQSLGVPVIGISARSKKSKKTILNALDSLMNNDTVSSHYVVRYEESIENAINRVEKEIDSFIDNSINKRWLSLRLIENDAPLIQKIFEHNERLKSIDLSITKNKTDLCFEKINDSVVSSIFKAAESIAKNNTNTQVKKHSLIDRKIDRILTGKIIGYPLMVCLLALIFWITITGANYPSEWLTLLFGKIENLLNDLIISMNLPEFIRGITVDGIYCVLSWVIAVMLPPMAIFFPLFTLLEDVGYMPRIAYNLDKPFRKCRACGKQALTMCMGFGCNAAGVVGCRIIDSPRERLLAIITNSFVPCNGRFPQSY